MPTTEESLQVIEDPRVRQVLVRLHREARRQHASLACRFASQLPHLLRRRPLRWDRLEPKLSDMYLALDPAAGVFGYLLARSLQARRIVEFGTSFGISTIYLALAVRENGGGCDRYRNGAGESCAGTRTSDGGRVGRLRRDPRRRRARNA